MGLRSQIRMTLSRLWCKVARYRLEVANGYYESDSLIELMWIVFKHRLSHLLNNGRWED